MEINPQNITPHTQSQLKASAAGKRPVGSRETPSAALKEGLAADITKALEDVNAPRPEKVREAQRLANDPDYPSAREIEDLAKLFLATDDTDL